LFFSPMGLVSLSLLPIPSPLFIQSDEEFCMKSFTIKVQAPPSRPILFSLVCFHVYTLGFFFIGRVFRFRFYNFVVIFLFLDFCLTSFIISKNLECCFFSLLQSSDPVWKRMSFCVMNVWLDARWNQKKNTH
jgi:hypothetical protein